MGDLLSWLLLLVLAVWFMTRRRPQNDDEAPPHEAIDSSTLLRPMMMNASKDWKPLMLEEPHDGRRRRLVLSIEYEAASDEGLERLLWTLATAVQERAKAHVVVVEAFAPGVAVHAGRGRARLLFAPDGAGWSGEEQTLAQWQVGSAPAQSYDLGQTQQRIVELS